MVYLEIETESKQANDQILGRNLFVRPCCLWRMAQRDLRARLHEMNAWVNRLIVRVGSLGIKSTSSMKNSYSATYRETKNTDVIKTPDFNLLISISLQTSLEIVFLFLSTIS